MTHPVSFKDLKVIATKDPDKVRRRLALALAKAGSIEALAQQLSCSPYAAHHIIDHLGIAKHDHHHRRKASILATLSEDEWKKHTDEEVAIKYGCTIWNVRRYRYRWRIRRRAGTDGRMKV